MRDPWYRSGVPLVRFIFLWDITYTYVRLSSPRNQTTMARTKASLNGKFHGIASKTTMSYKMKQNLDEIPTLNGDFYSMVSQAFNLRLIESL
jgi:hypothetical protein